jgi:hypothetical protein
MSKDRGREALVDRLRRARQERHLAAVDPDRSASDPSSAVEEKYTDGSIIGAPSPLVPKLTKRAITAFPTMKKSRIDIPVFDSNACSTAFALRLHFRPERPIQFLVDRRRWQRLRVVVELRLTDFPREALVTIFNC